MAFHFKYERILALKKDEEEFRKKKLAEKVAELAEKKRELKRFYLRKEAFNKKHVDKLEKGISVSKLKAYNSSKIWYLREENRLHKDIEIIDEELSAAREHLKKANIEVKKLEKLKEKDRIDYLKNEEKQFEKMIDEVVSYNFSKDVKLDNGEA